MESNEQTKLISKRETKLTDGEQDDSSGGNKLRAWRDRAKKKKDSWIEGGDGVRRINSNGRKYNENKLKSK